MAGNSAQMSDEEWAKQYGEGGQITHADPTYQRSDHKGTVEEASTRDQQIIDAATNRAGAGLPTPDSMLRRQ